MKTQQTTCENEFSTHRRQLIMVGSRDAESGTELRQSSLLHTTEDVMSGRISSMRNAHNNNVEVTSSNHSNDVRRTKALAGKSYAEHAVGRRTAR